MFEILLNLFLRLLSFYFQRLISIPSLKQIMNPSSRMARDPRLARLQSQSTPTPPSSSEALAPVINTAHSTLSTPQYQAINQYPEQTNTPAYKSRPLFCVVCASNQVGQSYQDPTAWKLTNHKEQVNGGSPCSRVGSFATGFFYSSYDIPVRLDSMLFRQGRAQRCAYLDRQ